MRSVARVCRRRTSLHMIPGRAMPSDSSRPSPRAGAGGVRLVEAPAVRRAVQLVLLGAALVCLMAAGAIVVIRLAPRPAGPPAQAGGVRSLAAPESTPAPGCTHGRARRSLPRGARPARADAEGPGGSAPPGAARPADARARARRDAPGVLSSPPARARLAALAAVTASALAFALYARMTWPWVALGWVGLVPWLAVLDRAGSARAALGAGLRMS